MEFSFHVCGTLYCVEAKDQVCVIVNMNCVILH